jgi:hypothetical protein
MSEGNEVEQLILVRHFDLLQPFEVHLAMHLFQFDLMGERSQRVEEVE